MMNIENIDIKDFRQKMLDLRASGMDFLREMVGMDWNEEGLGVIYILENNPNVCKLSVINSRISSLLLSPKYLK